MLKIKAYQKISELVIKTIIPCLIIFVSLGISLTNPKTFIDPLENNNSYLGLSKIINSNPKYPNPNISTVVESLSNEVVNKENLKNHFETKINGFVDYLNNDKNKQRYIEFEKYKYVILDLSNLWIILLVLSSMWILVDSILFSKTKNKNINNLISNIQSVILYTILLYCFSIIILYFTNWYLGWNKLFLKPIYNYNENLNFISVQLMSVFISVLSPVLIFLSVFIFSWLVLFFMRYFRIFKNTKIQNTLINSFIEKRSYVESQKSIRQKIKDIQKIKKFNSNYNSNYSNFTSYNKNIPNNQDFSFDVLEIVNSQSKSNLAQIKENSKQFDKI